MAHHVLIVLDCVFRLSWLISRPQPSPRQRAADLGMHVTRGVLDAAVDCALLLGDGCGRVAELNKSCPLSAGAAEGRALAAKLAGARLKRRVQRICSRWIREGWELTSGCLRMASMVSSSKWPE